MPDQNTLFYGDNLAVLPRIATESVDLIYLDPPFKSDARYNVLFRTQAGDPSRAQIHAFDDTWSWSAEADETLHALTTGRTSNPGVATFLHAMFQTLGKSDVMAYLVMMAPRLVEMRRVLKPAGSILLHCDPTASHYLKLLMDAVFGPECFQNEIVWHYGLGVFNARGRLPRKHDLIFFYGKQSDPFFNIVRGDVTEAMRKKYSHKDENGYYMLSYGKKYYLKGGKPLDDVWLIAGCEPGDDDVWDDIPTIPPTSSERLGYPTQKPRELLERIIQMGSAPDAVVLDPFCGCGTAVDAAEGLGRKWIGIDVAYIAIDLIRNRLVGRYGREILGRFKTDGVPQDMEGATALAVQNKIDFERWAVSLVRGQPTQASGDKGVDGWVYFARTYKEPLDIGKVVVSVKGGEQLNPGMVRDLSGTVIAREAQMGVLITLGTPSGGMTDEAVANGTYVHEATGTFYPKIQLITVADLLAGNDPKVPSPLPPYLQATWAPSSEAVPLF